MFKRTKLAKEKIEKKIQRGIPKKEYRYKGLRTEKGAVTLDVDPKYLAFTINR